MLYDSRGNAIPERTAARPSAGPTVTWEPSDRYDTDVSRALTPARVDGILTNANSGDIEEQCKLSVEIEEKNWDIAQAVGTRRLAVAGLDWELLPPEGDDSAKAAEIAAAAEQMLRSPSWDVDDEFDTFHEALFWDLQSALLPGFSVVELIWSKGLTELTGFQHIEQRHFTFLESRKPLLVTRDHPMGFELPASKFATHYYRARPGARCRGGLIRPLAWLHTFFTIGWKDLNTFIERYGMPFLIARVNQESWDKDRNRIKYLIQNFGPAGGAVFSESVQTELMQASPNTGDVYFRLLEYAGDAITKTVLGQTATSSDGGGLSNDNAQADVRQDLLESDCHALEATVRSQILRNWTRWNYGDDAPVPRLHLKCEPTEDLKQRAEVAKTLNDAGLEWDEQEASDVFGMTLRRRQETVELSAPIGAAADSAAMSAEPPMDAVEDAAAVALARFLRGNGLQEWFGPLQSRLDRLASITDDDQFRAAAIAMVADLPTLQQEMDTETFEQLLEQLTYAQAAEGQAAKAAELTGKQRS